MGIAKKYCGVVVPMATPFTKEGKIDKSAAKRIINHILDGGGAPFILGTTGESASVPLTERVQLARWASEEVHGRAILYAGISSNCVEESITLAQQFADLGVDVMVAHVPSYYPLSERHMLKYFELLAEGSPRPIMIYNIKSTTHMSIPLPVIEKLSLHPNIIGMKDSERDIDRMHRSIELFAGRQDFSLMCGWSAKSASILLAGFDGIVPSVGNVIPQMYHDLYQAAASGDENRAEQLQKATNPVAAIMQHKRTLSQSIAVLKAMMSAMGLCAPTVLPPLLPLGQEEQAAIQQKMVSAGLL